MSEAALPLTARAGVARRILRATKHLALALLALLLLYGLAALLLPRLPSGGATADAPRDGALATDGVTIWVLSNGVHTDFVVPTRTAEIDWSTHLRSEWFEECGGGGWSHVEIGWGDRGFYLETPTWADLKLSTALKAAFALGRSAVHVTWIFGEPAASETCRPLRLDRAQWRRLADALLSSFAREADGSLKPIDHPGYEESDRFFESNGRYSMITTCNAWSGSMLRSAGVRTGIWTPFAWDVMRWMPR